MQPDDDFPLNGLADPVRTGTHKSMYLRRQREYVCIGLKNASAYVPMSYAESPAPSAIGDSIYSTDSQMIPVCAGCHTFGNSIFQ